MLGRQRAVKRADTKHIDTNRPPLRCGQARGEALPSRMASTAASTEAAAEHGAAAGQGCPLSPRVPAALPALHSGGKSTSSPTTAPGCSASFGRPLVIVFAVSSLQHRNPPNASATQGRPAHIATSGSPRARLQGNAASLTARPPGPRAPTASAGTAQDENNTER